MFAKHNGWRKALRLAYPEVKFEGEEWKKQVRKRNQHKELGDWRDQDSRRQFFCEFAEERGLDPLSPATWENVTKRQITEKLVTDLLHFGFVNQLYLIFLTSIGGMGSLGLFETKSYCSATGCFS